MSDETVTTPAAKRGKRYQSRFLDKSAIAKANDPEKQAAVEEVDPAVFTTDPKMVEIWERRIINPNPSFAQEIHLKQSGWMTRWINTKAYPGRLQLAREQGYMPVKPDELKDTSEIVDLQTSPEGYVVRGDRGEEILMKIPEAVYKKVQRRKVELYNRQYEGKRFKEGIQSAAGEQYSGDHAEAVGLLKGTIKFGTERVAATEELDNL